MTDVNSNVPMTVNELATYLKLDRMTIYKMLREKSIPGIRLGHQWRFYESDIIDWLRSKSIEPVETSHD